MNVHSKTRYFIWLVVVAAAAVVLVVMAVAQRGVESSDVPQHQRWGGANADTHRVPETWDANSFVPEARLLREPALKLSPAPPLPDENQSVEFKPLPQTNPLGTSGDSHPPMQFAPLPKIESVVTRDLPPMDSITTQALPDFPATPKQDSQPKKF